MSYWQPLYIYIYIDTLISLPSEDITVLTKSERALARIRLALGQVGRVSGPRLTRALRPPKAFLSWVPADG